MAQICGPFDSDMKAVALIYDTNYTQTILGLPIKIPRQMGAHTIIPFVVSIFESIEHHESEQDIY